MNTPPSLDARYVSLATSRRDGREVRTPVWLVRLDGRYYAFSAADAGKVKRVRAQGRARLAPCDARGGNEGQWHPVRARIVEDPRLIAAAHAALRAKYGWQMLALDCLSRLAGRYDRRAYLEFELEAESA